MSATNRKPVVALLQHVQPTPFFVSVPGRIATRPPQGSHGLSIPDFTIDEPNEAAEKLKKLRAQMKALEEAYRQQGTSREISSVINAGKNQRLHGI